jgi:hypothetical protein
VKLTVQQLPLSLGRLENGYLFLSKITRNHIPVPRCVFGAFLISQAVSAEALGGESAESRVIHDDTDENRKDSQDILMRGLGNAVQPGALLSGQLLKRL